ncbi:MAG TPA: hypothetical protein VEG67_07145, partial [Myxococcota bacterium]|nr:hypothetical protein [Myxococcota bacterium]
MGGSERDQVGPRASADTVLVLTRAHARLALALALAFAGLVAAGIHGYSISIWHGHLDGSPPAEILWGKAQWLRMDDWMVQIPTSLAQRAHVPPFPVWNDKIGLGENMLVPIQLPVVHPLLLLRPFEWGWLLGPDVGMAWRWWLSALGLFACVFLMLEVVDGGRFWLSFAGSVFLLYSPFFQFWSLNASPFVCFAALIFVSGCGVLFARRRRALWWSALLLGWSCAAFLTSFYPPYQIALTQVLVLLFATTVLERWRKGSFPGVHGERLAALAVAALFPLAAAALVWHDAGDVISAIRHTAYPGARISVGGGRRLWEVFVHDTFAAAAVTDWSPLQNILQAAS